MIQVPDREPDLELVGYLKRWCLTPRSRTAGNLYLHHIVAPDPDRYLHDHPWWFATTVLAGGYTEENSKGVVSVTAHEHLHRGAEHLHLITRVEPDTWTLVLTGPVCREWGFQTGNGWVPHAEFEGRQDLEVIKRNGYDRDPP